MSVVSKITLPSGTSYDFKDAQAREDIAAIQSAMSSSMRFLGTSSTELSEGSGTSTITVGGKSVQVAAGDVVLYGEFEFIFGGADNKWHKFGPNGSFKALAFKDSASGDFTPSGTINVTPAVTLNTTTVNSITNVGTLPTCTFPELTATVSGETLTLGLSAGSFNAGTLPTKGADTTVATSVESATATGTFSGIEGTVTVS